MRFYELAKKHNVDGKALLEEVQKNDFDVKNTLAAVEGDVIEWVEKFLADGGLDTGDKKEAKPKKKSTKKKAAVKPAEKPQEPEIKEEAPEEKASEEAKPAPAKKPAPKKKRKVVLRPGMKPELAKKQEEEKPEPQEEEPKAAPQPEVAEEKAAEPVVEEKPKETKAAEKPKSAPEKAAKPAKAEAPKADAKKAKTGKAEGESKKTKAEKQAEKKARRDARKKKEEKSSLKSLAEMRDRQDKKSSKQGKGKKSSSNNESGPIMVDNEDHANKTGQKHKRADFRSQRNRAELPAIFSDLDGEYTHSILGGAKQRSGRGRRGRQRMRKPRGRRQTATIKRERDPNAIAQVNPGMTVRDLSVALGIKLTDIMGYLMKNGHLAQVNDILAEDEITLIAEEFDIKFEWKAEEDLEQKLEDMATEEEAAGIKEDMIERPPVITFLGHVDHGKTSLLDKIRETRVAAKESGGITQHIGAYSIIHNDQKVTFLDTPGHEAFTAMRARGASLTDIAVLIVAADDGVMPQTEEAVSHARSAEVPIVVAINKCDVPGANPDKVRQELANRLNLLPEEWGGQVGMINVSAMTGEGIDELLERILLEAEVLELKANTNRLAIGHVIEAQISESRGVVATMLVSDGTLNRGDIVLCSAGYGKVKLMFNEHGESLDMAPPGEPVRIVGLSSVPEAGDKFYVMRDILEARAIAEQRERDARNATLSRRTHVTLETLQAHLGENQVRDLNIVIKADVRGSLEVIEKTLTDLSTDEVRINVIHSAVGGINQADIILADASDAIVVGFHVLADSGARLQASSYGVQVKVYHVIYRLIEDMKAALSGLLPPEEKEVVQGHLEIREVFKASRIGTIAGCFVTDGLVTRTSKVRLIRDNIVIYDGEIETLKRFKDDAKEVRNGFECGLKIAGYNDIKDGDMVEAYTVEEIARTLD